MSNLEQVLQNAISLLQAGEFRRSRQLLQPLIRRLPGNPDVWQLYAVSLRGSGQPEQAREAFEKSLVINPRQPAVLNNLGNLLREIGKRSEAERAYRRAIAFQPTFQNALSNLGIVLIELQRYEEAVEVLERSLSLDKRHLWTLFSLGNAHRELGNYDAALDLYERVLALVPNHCGAIHNRALILKMTGNLREAIEGFEHALSLQPGLLECVHNLATSHALLGNRKEAEHYYRECVSLQPEVVENHHWLNLYLWATKSDDFLASHKDELARRPNNPELWVDFARKLCQAGKPEEARSALEQAVAKCDESPQLLSELSAVKRQLRDVAGVCSLALRARQLAPEDPSVLEELGRAYLAEGEYQDALKIFDTLLQRNPFDQGWWCMKATALRALGDSRYGELYDYSRFVAPLEIDVPPGYRSLGEFLDELIDQIRKYHTTDVHPLDQTLRTGTQSLESLFSQPDHAIQLYKQAVSEQVTEFLSRLPRQDSHPLLGRLSGSFQFSDSWSVILRDSGFHKNHFHSAGWFSSAFYILVPPEVRTGRDGRGWIKFGEPELYLPERFEYEYVVRPEPGLLVVFPSYMWHGTIPFRSTSERITAPFDILPA